MTWPRKLHKTFAVMFPRPHSAQSCFGRIRPDGDSNSSCNLCCHIFAPWLSIFIQFLLSLLDCSSISWSQARRIRVLGVRRWELGSPWSALLFIAVGVYINYASARRRPGQWSNWFPLKVSPSAAKRDYSLIRPDSSCAWHLSWQLSMAWKPVSYSVSS